MADSTHPAPEPAADGSAPRPIVRAVVSIDPAVRFGRPHIGGISCEVLAEGVYDDRCSHGPPGTCECSLGEHYRWLIKRSENGDTHAAT